jgi:hypothetical protein
MEGRGCKLETGNWKLALEFRVMRAGARSKELGVRSQE